jgi:hypothetical protein
MSQRLGVSSFRTAATLYLVGAILTIVLIGFVLLFVGQILQAAAYFSIPERPPLASGSSWTPTRTGLMAPQSEAPKFCTSCGSRMSASDMFCINCGAKQPGYY